MTFVGAKWTDEEIQRIKEQYPDIEPINIDVDVAFPGPVNKTTKDAAIFWRCFTLMRDGVPPKDAAEQAVAEVVALLDDKR